MSLEPQKHTKRMKINQSQTMTFWTRQVMFPKRSAKMIDCSKKCKCQLAFKLQNLHVFEKCGNYNYNPKQWALNHRNTQSGWKSTNHNLWPFEPVKFCFLRGRLRWLTAAKNSNVSWLLNFRICMFLKSAAILYWGIETVSCHLLR